MRISERESKVSTRLTHSLTHSHTHSHSLTHTYMALSYLITVLINFMMTLFSSHPSKFLGYFYYKLQNQVDLYIQTSKFLAIQLTLKFNLPGSLLLFVQLASLLIITTVFYERLRSRYQFILVRGWKRLKWSVSPEGTVQSSLYNNISCYYF